MPHQVPAIWAKSEALRGHDWWPRACHPWDGGRHLGTAELWEIITSSRSRVDSQMERSEGPVLGQFQKVKKTILQVWLNCFLLFTSQQHSFKLMWRPLRVAPFWGLDSDSVPSVTYPSVLGRNHFGFWSESFWVNCHHSSKWQHGPQSWSKKNRGGKPFISQTPCTWEGELALPSPELFGMAASVSSPSPLAEPFLFIFPFCLQCLPGLLLSPSVLRNVSPCCLFSSVSLHACHTSRAVC